MATDGVSAALIGSGGQRYYEVKIPPFSLYLQKPCARGGLGGCVDGATQSWDLQVIPSFIISW